MRCRGKEVILVFKFELFLIEMENLGKEFVSL